MATARVLSEVSHAFYRFRLLGQFSASLDGRPLDRLESSKLQSLLGYLLLNRKRAHSREALSNLFWADSPLTHSRKYLRQALWQLQQALQADHHGDGLLLVEPQWVQVNRVTSLSLDVDEFERLYAAGFGVAGRQLTQAQAKSYELAVDLYQGDLLEGCYQDWCLYERERLHNELLAILGKLMTYNSARGSIEAALAYGDLILRHDRASERVYAQMMRLHYRLGDRTAALRDFERCTAALREELGVEPQAVTVRLYRQIKADESDGLEPPPDDAWEDTASAAGPCNLYDLRDALLHLHSQVDRALRMIDGALSPRPAIED